MKNSYDNNIIINDNIEKSTKFQCDNSDSTIVNQSENITEEGRSTLRSSRTSGNYIKPTGTQNLNGNQSPSLCLDSSNMNVNNNYSSIGVVNNSRNLTSPFNHQIVRTTKASRLRAAALDKKKESHDEHQPVTISNSSSFRYSPKRKPERSASASSNDGANKLNEILSNEIGNTGNISPIRRKTGSISNRKSPSVTSSPRNSPSLTSSSNNRIIGKKSLSSSNSNQVLHPSSATALNELEQIRMPSCERISSLSPSPFSIKISENDDYSSNNNGIDSKRSSSCSTESSRPRSSTLNSTSMTKPLINLISENISPVKLTATVQSPTKDINMPSKMLKKKSIGNRTGNEESNENDDAATRRRRRRELGMSRQLIPTEETSMALRDVLGPVKAIQKQQEKSDINTPLSSITRSNINLQDISKKDITNQIVDISKKRANTTSPRLKNSNIPTTATVNTTLTNNTTENKLPSPSRSLKIDLKSSNNINRKSPFGDLTSSLAKGIKTENEYLRKNKRLSDVSRKVDAIRQRTKSELAEIQKITAKCRSLTPALDNLPTNSVEVPISPIEKPIPAERKRYFTIDIGAAASSEYFDSVNTKDEKLNGSKILEQNDVEMNNKPIEHIEEVKPIEIVELKLNETNEVEPSNLVKSFVKKDRISFDDDVHHFSDEPHSSFQRSHYRVHKAYSQDRDFSPAKESSLRRKSSDDPYSSTSASNHIVSILKKKDHTESSSASSNASPVTFSSNVVDTPTRSSSSKRQGILKKRSSLDESRYYSRSHSPDERSILVKTTRRNSLEEGPSQQQEQQQSHGILKQRSYESKSDGCPSAEIPHGILKKKDSTSTPESSGGPTRHISISQAVILAAAELCKDMCIDNTSNTNNPMTNSGGDINSNGIIISDYDIKPILKTDYSQDQDSMTIRQPKPILKKKASSETEEIRPILKTSRKSSREESLALGTSSDIDDGVIGSGCGSGSSSGGGSGSGSGHGLWRPILKNSNSPSKRRSLGAELQNINTESILMQRSHSLDNPDEAIDISMRSYQVSSPEIISPEEKPFISVAERIRNMEAVTAAAAGATSKLASTSRRETTRSRFRTQPITNDEINDLQYTLRNLEPRSLDSIQRPIPLSTTDYKTFSTRSLSSPRVHAVEDSLFLHIESTSPISLEGTNRASGVGGGSGICTSGISNIESGISSGGIGGSNTCDNNCTSLSSDSGLQTGKASDLLLESPDQQQLKINEKTLNFDNIGNTEISSSISALSTQSILQSDNSSMLQQQQQHNLQHNIDITPDSSLSYHCNDLKTIMMDQGANTNLDHSDSNQNISVKAKASMFQQLGEQKSLKTFNDDNRTSPINRRVSQKFGSQPSSGPVSLNTDLNNDYGTTSISLTSTTATTTQDPNDEDFDTPRIPFTTGLIHSPPPLHSPPPTTTTTTTNLIGGIEPPQPQPRKSILKSKSGSVGFMPFDLNAELKNRLRKSKHATVSNLRKSASTAEPFLFQHHQHYQYNKSHTPSSSSDDDDDEDGVDPQKNLAKLLRSVSKENMYKQQQQLQPLQHSHSNILQQHHSPNNQYQNQQQFSKIAIKSQSPTSSTSSTTALVKQQMNNQQESVKGTITPSSSTELSASQLQNSSSSYSLQHSDTMSLVKNLSGLDRSNPENDAAVVAAAAAASNTDGATGSVTATSSTSDGESSGGREISSIIKNSAVARRRKLNEG
ncbi:probable serine/threonine-protein kinase DDB_G0282963 [Condylostylus longicornis]|uniref:probable serine/threonine-protein kinase DDB_G0282963 n=1 Tax=Condylostylus longicornis TaxID=2530218 RepID=UPI00244DD566|nr:probable serine/threonine-protein kinase DDB_G0282963 [Condylostylus longicornis]